MGPAHHKNGIGLSIQRHTASQTRSPHIGERAVEGTQPGESNLVTVADLVVETQIEAADISRMWHQFLRVDSGCLSRRHRHKNVHQLKIDGVQGNVDDVSGEGLTGQGILDDYGRCAASAGKEAAKVSLAFGSGR